MVLDEDSIGAVKECLFWTGLLKNAYFGLDY